MFESTSIVNSTLPAPMIVTFGMRDIVPSGMESNKSRQGASVRRMKRLAVGRCLRGPADRRVRAARVGGRDRAPAPASAAVAVAADPACPNCPAPEPCPGCWLPPLVARWQYQLQGKPGIADDTGGIDVDICAGAGRGRRLRDAGGVRHRPLRRHEGLGRGQLRGEHGRRRRDPRGGRPRDLLPGRRRRRDVSPRLPTVRRLRRSVRRLPDRQPVQPGLPGRVLPEHQQRPGAAGVHPQGEPRSREEVRGGRVRRRGVGHHRYVRGLRTPGSTSATARS